jgi:hypothetical protein
MRQALLVQHLLLNVHVSAAELKPSVAQQGGTQCFIVALVLLQKALRTVLAAPLA